MELTLLYPLKALIQYKSDLVSITRYHPLTGVASTYDIPRTDVNLLTMQPIMFKDVLHTEIPRSMKPHNDREWPFHSDSTFIMALETLDICVFNEDPRIHKFDIDSTRDNVDLFTDLVENTLLYHDDFSFIDTLTHNQCSYMSIQSQIKIFVNYLKKTFNCPIDEANIIIQTS